MKRKTHCKQYKVFLIVFTDAIIHPWAMMVHFSNAPLTYRTVVSPLRLDTAAFCALEYNLTLTKTHLFYHLFRRVPFWYCALKLIY